jgi:hypothetical protein
MFGNAGSRKGDITDYDQIEISDVPFLAPARRSVTYVI